MASLSLEELIVKAAESARAEGLTAYLVGGTTRRTILGLPLSDIDIVVFARGGAMALASALSSCLPNTPRPITIGMFPTVEIRCGEHVVQISESALKISAEASKNPEALHKATQEDALRRDFTINTLLMPLEKPEAAEVSDPLGVGLKDLKKKVLRTPLEPAATFADDPIRLLRAIRFSCVEGFQINRRLSEAIKRHSSMISAMPGERINYEFSKIITGPRPDDGIRKMLELGLLDHVLPEIAALSELKQPLPYHKDDVLTHSINVLRNVEQHLTLRLAALFHDVGKAATGKEVDGRIAFHGHEHAGIDTAAEALKRLRYPNKIITDVSRLIQLHMIAYRAEWSDRAVRRLVRKAGDRLDQLMKLYQADILARKPPYNKLTEFEDLERRMQSIDTETIKKFDLPVSGGDVMELLGIKQGPRIGEVLTAVEMAIVDGKIPNDREAAKTFLIHNFTISPGEPT